jgi:hypothetical protein
VAVFFLAGEFLSMSAISNLPKSHLSWVESQHPPTQWNLMTADETVLKKALKGTVA